MSHDAWRRLQQNATKAFVEFAGLKPHVSLVTTDLAKPVSRLRRFSQKGTSEAELEIILDSRESGFWLTRAEEDRYKEQLLEEALAVPAVHSAYISKVSVEGSFLNRSEEGWVCVQLGHILLEFHGTYPEEESDYFEHLTQVFLQACLNLVKEMKLFSADERSGRSASELKREAGRKLIDERTAEFRKRDCEGFFDAFNKISALRYEGEIISGEIVFVNEDSKDCDYLFEFQTPFSLDDTRKVRKLFELSDPGESYLVLTKDGIVGVGETDLIAAHREESLSVEFNGHHKWELWKDGHSLMVVEYGVPRLKKRRISRIEFSQKMNTMFDSVEEAELEKLWLITVEAMKQKHGTMLVISDEAEKEAERLRAQSFKLSVPVDLRKKLKNAKNRMNIVNHVTSIDGAVLLDRKSICYAIGVILDGIVGSESGGDSSRGARYNSALRYREHRKEANLAIVVVSEDGTVDIL